MSQLLDLLAAPGTVPDCQRLAAHLTTEFPADFGLLFDSTLDATNWRAGQALRPAVVKSKVSGGNRSERGAEAQEILSSILGLSRRRLRSSATLGGVLRRHWIFAGLLSSLAVLQALAWRGWGPPPGQSWLSVFALFGAASLAVSYALDTRRARARLFVIGMVAGAAASVAWLLWQEAVSPRTAAQGGLALTALVGFAGYAWDIADSPDRAGRRRQLAALRDAALIPLAVAHVPFFLWMTTGINPVFDARVLAVEASLGVELSAIAHYLFGAFPGLSHVAMACYLALPVGLAAAVRLQPAAELQDRVFAAALIAGIGGFALYGIAPVVGIFPAFPAGLPSPDTVAAGPMMVTAEVPRNGMPSLHTVWALIIALQARRLAPVWRAGLTVFAALNLWAAAGAVGHWALDLIVAVPIAGMVHLAVTPGARRVRAGWMLACAAITLAWVAALRVGAAPTGDTPALVTWTAVLLTLAVPVAGLQQTGSFSASGRR